MTGLDTPEPSPTTAAREAFGQLSGRSPLLGWMRQNHALITERMNTVRPSWDDIARTLAGLGVRDANGQAPKTEAVRRAYHRVTGALNAKGNRRRRSKAQIAAAKFAAASAPVMTTSEPSTASAVASPTLAPPVAPSEALPVPAVVPPLPARSSFDPMEGAFDPKPLPRFKPASLK